MTPEALEYEIRMLPGVIACSITASAVTVLAAPSADAGAITESATTLAAIAGIGAPVVVIGGIGTIAPRAFGRLKAPVAAGAAVGIGSLLAAAVATALTGGVAWIPGVSTHESAAPRETPAATAPPQQVEGGSPTPRQPAPPRPPTGTVTPTIAPTIIPAPIPAPAPAAKPLQVQQPAIATSAPAITQAPVPTITVRTVPISATKPAPAATAPPATAPPATAPVQPPATIPPAIPATVPVLAPPRVETPPPTPTPASAEDSRRVAAAARRNLETQAHVVHQQSEALEQRADKLHDDAKQLRDRASKMQEELDRFVGGHKAVALTGTAKAAADSADQVVRSQIGALVDEAQRLESAADGLDADARQLASQARQLRDQAHSLR